MPADKLLSIINERQLPKSDITEVSFAHISTRLDKLTMSIEVKVAAVYRFSCINIDLTVS